MTSGKSEWEIPVHDESGHGGTSGKTGEARKHNSTRTSEAELEELKNSLAAEQEKAEKYLDQWKRAQADFDNYRKRTEQEKNDMAQNTTCYVISNILPVMDDLERALASIPAEYEKIPWVEGIQLIYKKMHAIMQSLGLEEVCATGKPFDPALHEAIAHTEGEEGKVIEEVQKGYKLRDRLVRPSQVVVGKGIGNSES